MKVVILYCSTKDEQSVLAKEIAYLKAEALIAASSTKTGSVITVHDISADTTANMLTYCGTTLADNTYDKIYVCCKTATGAGTNYTTLPMDAVAIMDVKLKTASRGTTVISGAALDVDGGAATTFIIPAADSPSSVDDAYKGMFLRTAGSVAVTRTITGYTGSTRVGTIRTSTTTLTNTNSGAYVIYTNNNIHVIGDKVSNKEACRGAWETLFPNVQIPAIVALLGGSGTDANTTRAFQPHHMYATAWTSSDGVTFTATGAFTAHLYDSANYYIGIESGTLGVGQICRIASNANANVLTLADGGFLVTPTGTVVFQITHGNNFTLYDKYLPYAIKTYLGANTTANHAIFKAMLDRYDMSKVDSTAAYFPTDVAELDKWAAKGKAIFDSIANSVATAA